MPRRDATQVLPPTHTFRRIECSRCAGDPGVCMAKLSERGLTERRAFASSPLNASDPHPTGGRDAQTLLHRWLGRRAWPFPADNSIGTYMPLERRGVVLVSRPSPPRMFVPGLEAAFIAALRNATGRDVRVYYGNETVAQTVTDAARHAADSYTTTTTRPHSPR